MHAEDGPHELTLNTSNEILLAIKKVALQTGQQCNLRAPLESE